VNTRPVPVPGRGPDRGPAQRRPAGDRHAAWRLRQWLAALVALATLLTFGVVGAALLLLRVPQLEAEHRALVVREAAAFAERQQAFLVSIERRVDLLASALALTDQTTPLLDAAVADGVTLQAVYRLDPQGRVQAVGLPAARREARGDLLGHALSRLPVVVAPITGTAAIWSDRYVSPLSGEVTVALRRALLAGGALLAEVPLPALLRMAHAVDPVSRAVGAGAAVWLIDRRGEVLVDSADDDAAHRLNLHRSPLLAGLPPDGAVVQRDVTIGGRAIHAAVASAPALGWRFVARVPAGLAHPRVRATVGLVLGAFVAALAVGLMLAPWLARNLSAAVTRLVAHAQRLIEGDASQAWPRGRVQEFNTLADALAVSTGALRRREVERAGIFDTAPVAMAVVDLAPGAGAIVDVNEAWCRLFGYVARDVRGRSGGTLALWQDPAVRDVALAQAWGDSTVDTEAWLRRADGSVVLCRVTGRRLSLDGRDYMVWANEDITETRRIERALRDLNARLEDRVAERTHALAQANDELRGTLEHLRATRNELLRAERLAALGRLVAGVAHELNTPLGNGLMAVSTLRDEAERFRAGLAEGLRRSALEGLLASVDQATAIAGRNLQRAGELVTGFKQVAADQTSEQRRRFALDELVREIVLTLQPSFRRAAHDIVVDVASGVQLDSYPGALGQAVTNLVTNALVHAFEGRTGQVRIIGRAVDGDQASIVVADDGVGIPADQLGRIFEPFVTSRMGRGGTGLGLNIAHNAVVEILRGRLDVDSTPGQGSRFTIRIPRVVPVAPDKVA